MSTDTVLVPRIIEHLTHLPEMPPPKGSRALATAVGDSEIFLSSITQIVKHYNNITQRLQAGHDHPRSREWSLDEAAKRDLVIERDGLKASFIDKKKAVRAVLALIPGHPEALKKEAELKVLQEHFREVRLYKSTFDRGRL